MIELNVPNVNQDSGQNSDFIINLSFHTRSWASARHRSKAEISVCGEIYIFNFEFKKI